MSFLQLRDMGPALRATVLLAQGACAASLGPAGLGSQQLKGCSSGPPLRLLAPAALPFDVPMPLALQYCRTVLPHMPSPSVPCRRRLLHCLYAGLCALALRLPRLHWVSGPSGPAGAWGRVWGRAWAAPPCAGGLVIQRCSRGQSLTCVKRAPLPVLLPLLFRYLEEEAVGTYTAALANVDEGGGGSALASWAHRPAPDIAAAYWRLPQGATLRDLLLNVRADEVRVGTCGGRGSAEGLVPMQRRQVGSQPSAGSRGWHAARQQGLDRCWRLLQAAHSHVNHTLSELGRSAENPFARGSVHVP